MKSKSEKEMNSFVEKAIINGFSSWEGVLVGVKKEEIVKESMSKIYLNSSAAKLTNKYKSQFCREWMV